MAKPLPNNMGLSKTWIPNMWWLCFTPELSQSSATGVSIYSETNGKLKSGQKWMIYTMNF